MLDAIDERTLLVALSHVLFKTAELVDPEPVVRRAHEAGAHVFLDAYQSVGAVPLDVTALGVDFATGGSVKWLCGGPGAAWLYVRPDLAERLEPAFTGWQAHEQPFAFEPEQRYAQGAQRFLTGTPNVPALYAATAGYDLIEELGVDPIRSNSLRLTTLLIRLLDEAGLEVTSERDPHRRGGTVCVRTPHFEAVHKELAERQILCDFRPDVGLRLGPHYFTTEDELALRGRPDRGDRRERRVRAPPRRGGALLATVLSSGGGRLCRLPRRAPGRRPFLPGLRDNGRRPGRGRRAQGRHRPVRRSRRLHEPRGAAGSRGRARRAGALRGAAAGGARALRRHGREVHRGRRDGPVRRAGLREDDPERAVRAALAIRDAVADLNEAGPAFELRVRVGVNTGEALVALGARPEEGEATASGDVVNTAKRLEEAAPPGGVLVGEATWRATRDAIEYRTAEPVVAKGKAEPVRPGRRWRRGPRSAPTCARDGVRRSSAVRTRSTCCGTRSTERGVTARRSSSRSSASRASGRAGWCEELASALDAEPDLVFWRRGRSLPYGEGVTFWAAAEMVKAQAGVLATDTADEAGTKLALAVRALVADEAEARWVESHLRRLVGIGSERAPEERREREFSAWRRFFEAMAEQRPLVLVFEDLHWADDALLDFVDELVDRSADVPLLVIATARPELLARRPGWGGGKRNATTISLSPLTDEQTARLLGALLERAVLQADVQTELLALVGGNPLCAEEYVRMLIDRGLVSGGRIATGPPLPLPETVQGIIAARLDALGADEKALVQDAAVVGRSFWPGALVALGIRRRTGSESSCTASSARSSCGASARPPWRRRRSTPSRTCSSATWRTARSHVRGAGSATGGRPTGWSRSGRTAPRTARRCSRTTTSRPSSSTARRGGTPRSSRSPRGKALRAAAERASALHAPAAAARLYGEALELWPADDPDRDELVFRRGRALLQSGEPGAELVARARDALLRAGRKEVAAEAEVTLADDAWAHGRSGEALEALGRARDLLADSPPTPVKAYVHSRFTGFLMADGQEERALELGRQTLAMAEGLGLEDVFASVLVSIGVARTSLGDVGGLARPRPEPRVRGAHRAGRGRPQPVQSRERVREPRRARARVRPLRQRSRGGTEARGSGGDACGSRPRVSTSATGAASGTRRSRRPSGRLRAGRASMPLSSAHPSSGRAATSSARRPSRRVHWRSPARPRRPRRCCRRSRLPRGRPWIATISGPRRRCSTSCAGSGPRPSSSRASGPPKPPSPPRRRGAASRSSGCSTARRARTRWIDAACTYLAEDFAAAADTFAVIGSAPDEAFARLRAAESLVLAGRRAEADVQLRSALAFHRAVGARRYVRAGEALLSASA